LDEVSTVDVVGIDEAQFFDESLPEVCDILALKGTRVIVAGLDMDYQGKPFGQMPAMLSRAEYITKLHAICMQCGNIANYSYRKSGIAEQLLIGNKDVYEPRCRICYAKGESQANVSG
jgi:thymidine kinase